jgi:alpha-beta hydrolase superfamily lysophospholipase
MLKTLAKHALLFAGYGAGGALVAVVAGAVILLEARPDLEPWHEVELEHEFVEEKTLESFADYLTLEAALFEELDHKIVDNVDTGPETLVNRYSRGSLASPDRWDRDWNRSFELDVERPVAGALMLHGMSDSPYSMRALAEQLRSRGVQVLALRYPGHGTAPASLTTSTWEDLAAAVRLAARHLAAKLDGRPLYLFGYSTGGPLAVDLVIRGLEDESLPEAAGLILFSPAMGITSLAALAPWQARLGRFLGFQKMAWNSLSPEHDPFKYRSFPVNAAVQVWRLSNHVEQQLAGLEQAGRMDAIPPVLSFQSVVDDTIDVSALRRTLYDRLPSGVGHGVFVYDINRRAGMEPLLADDPGAVLNQLLVNRARNFDMTVVTNQSLTSELVVRKSGRAGRGVEAVCVLDEAWPADVYSLTHIALPFPPDDPLYGGPDAAPYPGIRLGDVVLRGEGSALRISPAGFLRQTWNPFFEEQLHELLEFMGLEEPRPCRGARAE